MSLLSSVICPSMLIYKNYFVVTYTILMIGSEVLPMLTFDVLYLIPTVLRSKNVLPPHIVCTNLNTKTYIAHKLHRYRIHLT